MAADSLLSETIFGKSQMHQIGLMPCGTLFTPRQSPRFLFRELVWGFHTELTSFHKEVQFLSKYSEIFVQ
jgi:hypothetical protein